MIIDEIIKICIDKKASDIHLRSGNHPILRINGALIPEANLPIIDPNSMENYFNAITSEAQQERFFNTKELDFAYSVSGLCRFRVNAAFQRGSITMAFRMVKTEIPTIEQLGLPEICKELALNREGLLIITGPTGSGKSTTLAAMMEYINLHTRKNIITIEDPIEYMHVDKHSMFSQREIGSDTDSFANALKHALRQDPDVILVGEMRDLESMAIALTAAETGHLVLTTLHTPSSYQAVDRFVDVFPPHQHQQVRVQLSTTLKCVLYQRLLVRADEKGLVPAVEIMLGTPAIRNLIREGKTYQIPNSMQSGIQFGMQTLNQALLNLHRTGLITNEEYKDNVCDDT